MTISFIWATLLLVYWISYLWSRIGMFYSRKMSKEIFVMNVVLLFFIILLIYKLFVFYGLLNKITFFTITTLGISGLIHHTSILLEKVGKKLRLHNLFHGSINHFIFFVCLAFNDVYFGLAMSEVKTRGFDKVFFYVCVAITFFISMLGLFEKTRDWISEQFRMIVFSK